MTSKRTRLYQLVLYLSKFVIDERVVSQIAAKLPALLSLLGIKNENVRFALVDRVQLILKDLNELSLGDGLLDELSKSTRRFIKLFVIIFGVLVNLTSYKNLYVNVTRKRYLDGIVDLASARYLAKIASALTIVPSIIPLVNKLLLKLFPNISGSLALSLATSLPTLISTKLLPKGHSQDYLALYAGSYGLESYLSYLNDTHGWNFKSAWFLLPISFAELFSNYIKHPEYLPNYLKKPLDWSLKCLIETKPFIESFSIQRSILKTPYNSSDLLLSYEKITNFLLIPTIKNSNLINVLLKYIPKKAFLLTLLLLPVYLLKESFKKLQNSEKTSTESVKSALYKAFVGSIKFSLSVILSSSTAFTLLTLNDTHFKNKLNLKLIGAISSLWFLILLKLESFNKGLLVFLTRRIFLGTRPKLEKTYGEKVAIDWLNPLLTSVGFGLLAGLYRDQKKREFISPRRLVTLLSFIIKQEETY